MIRYLFLVAMTSAVASCSSPAKLASTSETYTLYRNSRVDSSARIHWATFNVDDGGGGTGTYNEENCALAADVLNQNLRRLNGGEQPVRFWCERGSPKNVSNKS